MIAGRYRTVGLRNFFQVLRGVVYNVTEYLLYHPGGKDELLRGAGRSPNLRDLFKDEIALLYLINIMRG